MSPRVVEDPGELIALFGRDKHLHIYALCDLEEPYWSASTWWRDGDAALGLVGLPEGDSIVYAVSSADPKGTLRLAEQVADEIPGTLVTGVTGIASVLVAAGRTIVWERCYHRFSLPDRSLVPPVSNDIQELGPDNANEVARLYEIEAGSAFFLPSMLESETFVGIRRGELLVAAAGTHVISEAQRVAAIGAVFTHPDHRGHGFGAATTAGVIARLNGRVDTIGLNCTVANGAARRIYTAMGFVQTLAYDECELSR